MIAAPWYLLAAGSVLLILGLIWAAASGHGGSRGTFIDPRMTDKDIARSLKRGERGGFAGLLIWLGLLCVIVSIAWRIGRRFF